MPPLPSPPEARALLDAEVGRRGALDWLDVHTHVGQHDPDGTTCTPAELLAGLDEAGHREALVFAMHEPGGYPPANDETRTAAEASSGRLRWLARIDPNAPGAVDEAERCLDAGARGVKLHPRSDAFALDHPVVAGVLAVLQERGLPVLIHAGRGIPRLGAHAAALAERFPRVGLILAHAGVSDLGGLEHHAGRLPNLLFDTSWWHTSDLLQLLATVPPGQVLYASDLPYGSGVVGALGLLRCARELGLPDATVAQVAGDQSRRLLAGEPLLDLGPPPGAEAIGPRVIAAERVASWSAAALQSAYRGTDPVEALALARCACQRPDGDASGLGALLRRCDALLARAEEVGLAADGEALRHGVGIGLVQAVVHLASTPRCGDPVA